MSLAGLVDAFDAENAGNFADIDEDGFQLTAVGDFQIGVNAGVGAVGTAFEVVNIGTRSADDGGDFGKQAGAVARTDGELDGEGGFGAAAPLDGDAAFGLVHEILDVGTHASVYGNTAAARDVADNFVAGNGIAAFGAVNEQIAVALDDERRFAEAQHPFYCFDNRRLGVDGFGFGNFLEAAAEVARFVFE